MQVTPHLVHLDPITLIGRSCSMSLVDNRTSGLWHVLITDSKEIGIQLPSNKYALQIYPTDYFRAFDPHRIFIKWAAIPLEEGTEYPEGWEPLHLSGGQYAVFHYKGHSSDQSIYQYIYSKWLPQSSFKLDDRPHFELLGAAYRNEDVNSEEQIFIPITRK